MGSRARCRRPVPHARRHGGPGIDPVMDPSGRQGPKGPDDAAALLAQHRFYRETLVREEVTDCHRADADLYEMAWALKMGGVRWDDMTPRQREAVLARGWTTKADYGVDIVSRDLTEAAQCKNHAPTTSITWTHFAKFHTMAAAIGVQPRQMRLLTNPHTPIAKQVLEFSDRHGVAIQRETLRALLAHLGIDAGPGLVVAPAQATALEERPFMAQIVEHLRRNDTVALLPCGAGKTYAAVHAFERLFPTGRMLFVVPSLDLRTQTVKLLAGRGHRVHVARGTDVPVDAPVVIATYQWLAWHELRGHFDLMVLDEAHHVHGADKWRRGVDRVDARRRLLLSATLYEEQEADVAMTIDEAVRLGYVTDYVIHCLYVEGGTGEDLLPCICAKAAASVRSWGPTLIYWSNVERARGAAERLGAAGTPAACLTGESTEAERTEAIERLRRGEVRVISLCGVMNEGISIDEVQTVVFGDTRESVVNLQQVAQRGSRRHPSKSHARIVLFTGLDDLTSETRIGQFIRAMAMRDSRLADSVRARDGVRFRPEALPVGEGAGVEEAATGASASAAAEASEEATVVHERLYTRCAELVRDKSSETYEVLKALLERGEQPTQRAVYSADGVRLRRISHKEPLVVGDDEFLPGILLMCLTQGRRSMGGLRARFRRDFPDFQGRRGWKCNDACEQLHAWLVETDGALPTAYNSGEVALYQTLYNLRVDLNNDNLSARQRQWLPQLRTFPRVVAYLATDDAAATPFQDWIRETRGKTLPVPKRFKKTYQQIRTRATKVTSAGSDRIIAAYPESAMARDLVAARDAKALRIAPLRQLRGLKRLLDRGHAVPHLKLDKNGKYPTGSRIYLHPDTGAIHTFAIGKKPQAVDARQRGLVDIAAPVNWACGLSRPAKIENGDRAEFEALRAELEPRVRAGFDFEGGGLDGGPDGSPKRPRLTNGATS